MAIPPAFNDTNFPCENVPLSAGIDSGFGLAFKCIPGDEVKTTRVKVIGGVPPYIVAATLGKVTAVDVNLFDIKIDDAVTIGNWSGSIGDVRFVPLGGTPTCNSAQHGAYVRLGRCERNKGIFADCRHHCDFIVYNCHSESMHAPGSSDTILGDNIHIIEPNDCPFCEVTGQNYQGFPAGSPYGTNGKAFGPCYDASLVTFSFPHTWYSSFGGDPAPGGDYAECGHGKPFDDDALADITATFEAHGGPIQDVRHPNLKAAGCSPCALDKGKNSTVTVIDFNNDMVIVTIPIL